MSDPTDKDEVPAEGADQATAVENSGAAAGGSAADAEKSGAGAGESAAAAQKSGAGAGESGAAAEQPATATGDSAAAEEPGTAAGGSAAGAEKSGAGAGEAATGGKPAAPATPAAGAAAPASGKLAKSSVVEAAGESSTTAATEPASESTASGRKLTRPVIALAATAALLVAAIATSITLFVQNNNLNALEDARAEAQAAACTYAPVLAEYDAKNLDAYFQGVLDGATGDWKQQFADTSKELRDVLAKGEVISKADDVQCAIKSADETSAEAIVVIGQTITSLGTQGKPAPGQLSMVMRLQKIDGRWLVNNVNSPLAPNQP
ncbi:hypothetical protein [Nocardia asteroides]|uniref:hypothetical protein n=1 Tax=Nocardia asteroides TaxID=1824 RepID=UPI001E65C548|nr:hypothetical protein [Nocardia asteroides]UGT63601.1 hypothetical protein LTT61_09945 [Nocardia asteroides]